MSVLHRVTITDPIKRGLKVLQRHTGGSATTVTITDPIKRGLKGIDPLTAHRRFDSYNH